MFKVRTTDDGASRGVGRAGWRRGYAAVLGTSIVALAVAFWLPAAGVPMLECRFRRWTGFPCPTCGYTRGVKAVLHGELRRALSDCPAAVLVTVVFVIMALTSVTALLRGRPWPVNGDTAVRRRQASVGFLVVMVLVLLNWIWRLLNGLV